MSVHSPGMVMPQNKSGFRLSARAGRPCLETSQKQIWMEGGLPAVAAASPAAAASAVARPLSPCSAAAGHKGFAAEESLIPHKVLEGSMPSVVLDVKHLTLCVAVDTP